jgi:transposase InsO family protein
MVECEEATNVSVFWEAYQTMDALVKNSIYIYNEKRPHFSCFYKTPKQMHQQNEIKIKTYKNKYP